MEEVIKEVTDKGKIGEIILSGSEYSFKSILQRMKRMLKSKYNMKINKSKN